MITTESRLVCFWGQDFMIHLWWEWFCYWLLSYTFCLLGCTCDCWTLSTDFVVRLYDLGRNSLFFVAVSSRIADYENSKLVRILNSSKCHKARLLHYFPALSRFLIASCLTWLSVWCAYHTFLTNQLILFDVVTIWTWINLFLFRFFLYWIRLCVASRETCERNTDMASWCGWHLDHGSLTGYSLDMRWWGIKMRAL